MCDACGDRPVDRRPTIRSVADVYSVADALTLTGDFFEPATEVTERRHFLVSAINFDD